MVRWMCGVVRLLVVHPLYSRAAASLESVGEESLPEV